MGESDMNLDFIKLAQPALPLLFVMCLIYCNLDLETVIGTLFAVVPSGIET